MCRTIDFRARGTKTGQLILEPGAPRQATNFRGRQLILESGAPRQATNFRARGAKAGN